MNVASSGRTLPISLVGVLMVAPLASPKLNNLDLSSWLERVVLSLQAAARRATRWSADGNRDALLHEAQTARHEPDKDRTQDVAEVLVIWAACRLGQLLDRFAGVSAVMFVQSPADVYRDVERRYSLWAIGIDQVSVEKDRDPALLIRELFVQHPVKRVQQHPPRETRPLIQADRLLQPNKRLGQGKLSAVKVYSGRLRLAEKIA